MLGRLEILHRDLLAECLREHTYRNGIIRTRRASRWTENASGLFSVRIFSSVSFWSDRLDVYCCLHHKIRPMFAIKTELHLPYVDPVVPRLWLFFVLILSDGVVSNFEFLASVRLEHQLLPRILFGCVAIYQSHGRRY